MFKVGDLVVSCFSGTSQYTGKVLEITEGRLRIQLLSSNGTRVLHYPFIPRNYLTEYSTYTSASKFWKLGESISNKTLIERKIERMWQRQVQRGICHG